LVNILNECLRILIDCSQFSKTYYNVLLREIVRHDAYTGGRFRWTKITHKASDAAENLQLYRVVQFFHPRSSCTTPHILAAVQRITLNALCMTISGGRIKRLDIFCHVGFTSDFLSFIVVELIRFFHGALQLITQGLRLTGCRQGNNADLKTSK